MNLEIRLRNLERVSQLYRSMSRITTPERLFHAFNGNETSGLLDEKIKGAKEGPQDALKEILASQSGESAWKEAGKRPLVARAAMRLCFYAIYFVMLRSPSPRHPHCAFPRRITRAARQRHHRCSQEENVNCPIKATEGGPLNKQISLRKINASFTLSAIHFPIYETNTSLKNSTSRSRERETIISLNDVRRNWLVRGKMARLRGEIQ